MSDEPDGSRLLDDGGEWEASNAPAPELSLKQWDETGAPHPVPGWTPDEAAGAETDGEAADPYAYGDGSEQ